MRTDDFGWGQQEHNPPEYTTPAFHETDVINVTRRGATFTQPWQPDENIIIGPVYGQSLGSPFYGNIESGAFIMQTDDPPTRLGPAIGGTTGPITWNQWLASTEQPDSSEASRTFAMVRDFPYAFRGEQ